jgi:hypothetical protein
MSDAPPKVPEAEADLSRAVVLLNRRTHSTLDRIERAEIKQLVGIYPTPAQATAWKQAFKRKIAHLVVQGLS